MPQLTVSSELSVLSQNKFFEVFEVLALRGEGGNGKLLHPLIHLIKEQRNQAAQIAGPDGQDQHPKGQVVGVESPSGLPPHNMFSLTSDIVLKL